MKTIRLTKLESAAYAAGERCFWRAIRKTRGGCVTFSDYTPCPYGTTGDRIRLSTPNPPFLDTITEPVITAITVTQRDGKWGWLVEVGA